MRKMNIEDFQKIVWGYYKKYKRNLPWRVNIDPYSVVVSEVMLQQTQVSRILTRFPEFMAKFPDWKSLAIAPLADVLGTWSGIGYNRRALYLKKIAEIVHTKYHDKLPNNPTVLENFPGIGKATAGSIIAFAYNLPTVFIETNIRRVFMHHFFADKDDVHDREIMPLIVRSVDQKNPREWYWALLDYGTYLAKEVENPNRRSRHYSVQSKFEGSDRQMRGIILKQLLLNKSVSEQDIMKAFPQDKDRIARAFRSLAVEGLIQKKDGYFEISNNG